MSGPIIFALFIQFFCVLVVAFVHRHHVSVRLNILVVSAFVTVPIWVYAPLDDVGIIYLFDLIVPVLFLLSLYQRSLVISRSIVIIGILVFALPLIYSPLGYIFVDPEYTAYHAVILTSVLYRALLIFIAVVILTTELRKVSQLAFVRLMAFQFLTLFMLGAIQYGFGIDFVVYERIKDTENIVDLILTSDQRILFGFGFLGLFRGAVSQMAVIGLFWWLLLSMNQRATRGERYLLDLMCVLAIACVVAALSKIGVIAIAAVLIYIMYVNKRFRMFSFIYILVVLIVVFLQPDFREGLYLNLDLLADRFGVEQFTGQAGSGGTRIESAYALLNVVSDNLWPWLIGLGGFNPIATQDYYGVFGMHGDYLDVIARYGVIVGLIYTAIVFGVFSLELKGFFSRFQERRVVARSFALFLLGTSILALTQGALMFSGAAGYLACAQAWIVLAFVITVRKPFCRNLV